MGNPHTLVWPQISLLSAEQSLTSGASSPSACLSPAGKMTTQVVLYADYPSTAPVFAVSVHRTSETKSRLNDNHLMASSAQQNAASMIHRFLHFLKKKIAFTGLV